MNWGLKFGAECSCASPSLQLLYACMKMDNGKGSASTKKNQYLEMQAHRRDFCVRYEAWRSSDSPSPHLSTVLRMGNK